MSRYEALDRSWEDIRRCYRCGYCRDMVRGLTGTMHPCPVRENLRHEHYTARGRNTIARGLIEGKLEFSWGLRDAIYTCLGCGGCKDACSLIDWAKVDTPAITQALREELHNLGMTPRKIRSVQLVKEAQAEARDISPCRHACPIDQDAAGYVGFIAQGRFSEALKIIRATNPLPSVCGRACTHPCELTCRQSEIGEPISIMRLKRFCLDWEAKHGPVEPQIASALEKGPVAVIGSGPAGLAAANYLARQGFKVTIFEKNELPGGMLAYGIPDFTLPREMVFRDIDQIKSLGVKIVTGVAIGQDKGLETLSKEGYKAILLCLGASKPITMGLPGENLDGVMEGLSFLLSVKNGKAPPVPESVLVVGGGKAALDVARTAKRLGAKEVFILYRRIKEEMPVETESVEQALAEGICLYESWIPEEILGKSGKVHGVRARVVDCIEKDEEGCVNVVCVEGSEHEFSCQMVIFAIGQTTYLSELEKTWPIRLTPQGLIAVDEKYQTGAPIVFAAGDSITGPTSIVEAMASGLKAARSIAGILDGALPEKPGIKAARNLKLDPKLVAAARTPMPTVGLEQGLAGFIEMVTGFSEENARREANRCLACDLKRFPEFTGLEQADTLFFVGCNNRFRYPGTTNSALEIMSRGGMKVTLADEELCCGSPAVWSGNRAQAERLRDGNIELFKQLRIKKIVTACSDCYAVLKRKYPLDDLGIELNHFAVVLHKLIESEKVYLNAHQCRITYHDPCQLAREGKIVDEPRAVLEKIEGLELIELTRTKEGTHCCGGGPNRLVALSSTCLAEEIGQERMREVKESGAQALVTACPWCKTHFQIQQGEDFKIYDLPDFIYSVVGIK